MVDQKEGPRSSLLAPCWHLALVASGPGRERCPVFLSHSGHGVLPPWPRGLMHQGQGRDCSGRGLSSAARGTGLGSENHKALSSVFLAVEGEVCWGVASRPAPSGQKAAA